MKKVLDEAAALHATYQITMTAITKRTSTVEIKPRKNTLCNTAFEMCNLISLSYIVVHYVKQKMCGDKRVSQLAE